jgi:hypothetical protein
MFEPLMPLEEIDGSMVAGLYRLLRDYRRLRDLPFPVRRRGRAGCNDQVFPECSRHCCGSHGPPLYRGPAGCGDRPGKSFFGTTFIAMSTSLPEAVVSIAALKIGAADMAIANLLGQQLVQYLNPRH